MNQTQADKEDALRKEEERLMRNVTAGGGAPSRKRITMNLGKAVSTDAALKEEEAKANAEAAERKRTDEAKRAEEERQRKAAADAAEAQRRHQAEEEERRRRAEEARKETAVVAESNIKPTGAEDPEKLDKEERRLRRHSQKGVSFKLAEGPVPAANIQPPTAVPVVAKSVAPAPAAPKAAPAPAATKAPAAKSDPLNQREEELRRREQELRQKEEEFERKQKEAAIAAREAELKQRERELEEKMRKAAEEEEAKKRKAQEEAKKKEEDEKKKKAQDEAKAKAAAEAKKKEDEAKAKASADAKKKEEEAKKKAADEAKRKEEEDKKKAAQAKPAAAAPVPASPKPAAAAPAAASPKAEAPARALPTPKPLTMNIQLADNARAAITRLQTPEADNAALTLVCNVKSGVVEMQQYYENASLQKVAEDIPEGSPRFILCRHYIDLDGKTRKLLLMLIYLNPVNTNPQLKKLYQTTKDELLKGYPSLKTMDITALEDLTDEKLRAKMLGKRN